MSSVADVISTAPTGNGTSAPLELTNSGSNWSMHEVGAGVVGPLVGALVGSTVGPPVGELVGATVGPPVGKLVGAFVGPPVGE